MKIGKWLIVGASGFIGRNLAAYLLSQGRSPRCLSRQESPADAPPGLDWMVGHFTDPATAAASLAGVDCVVFLPSTVVPANSNADPGFDIRTNLLDALAFFNQCVHSKISKLIVISSGGTVYGPQAITPIGEESVCNPICSYGIVKLAVEHYLALFRSTKQLDSVVLRVSNPYGPHQLGNGQGFIAAAMRRAIRGERIEVWGDGSVVRDFIHVDDVALAICRAASVHDPAAPRLYNIGSGRGRSIKSVLQSIGDIHGPLHVDFMDARQVDVPVSILDVHRAKIHLDWEPAVAWESGLQHMYDYMRTRIR